MHPFSTQDLNNSVIDRRFIHINLILLVFVISKLNYNNLLNFKIRPIMFVWCSCSYVFYDEFS